MRWTGPRDAEHDGAGNLKAPVPPEQWPYGPPSFHEEFCSLHAGGLFCDCLASDEGADGIEWGNGA